MTAPRRPWLTEAEQLRDLAASLPRIIAEVWSEGWVSRDTADDPSPHLRRELERHATTRRLAELAARYGAVAEATRPNAAMPTEGA